MTDEWIMVLSSDLQKAITDALTPVVQDANRVKVVCQQALDLARERTGVLEVVHAQNLALRIAVQRRLLDDTEHARHNCGDSPDECPVAFARMVMRGPVKQ